MKITDDETAECFGRLLDVVANRALSEKSAKAFDAAREAIKVYKASKNPLGLPWKIDGPSPDNKLPHAVVRDSDCTGLTLNLGERRGVAELIAAAPELAERLLNSATKRRAAKSGYFDDVALEDLDFLYRIGWKAGES